MIAPTIGWPLRSLTWPANVEAGPSKGGNEFIDVDAALGVTNHNGLFEHLHTRDQSTDV